LIQEEDSMKDKISRRQLIRGLAMAGGGALLAACGAPAATPAPDGAGAPAEPAAPAAPAATEAPKPTEAPKAAAGGTLVVLHRQEYFKELEDALKQQTTDYITSIGMTPDVSTVNPEVFGDFMAKMQAAVQAGNPPDLAYHFNSIAQMYDQELAEDHTAIVDELVSKHGDVVPTSAPRNARFEGKWYSVPHSSSIGGWFVRKDVAAAAGVDLTKFNTPQERLDAALKMSDPAKQMYGWGMTVNKSGDGHGLISTIVQAFGGRSVDETGKKITFNSPETVAGVQWLADIYSKPEYKNALPPGVESWTDSSNNEAYLAGNLAITTNAPSVYAKAKKDGNPVFANTAWLNFPTTNDGKLVLGSGGSAWYTIFKGAKNMDGAKQVIMHFMDPKVFAPLAALGGGLVMPAYKNGWTEDLLKVDPNFTALRDTMFNPNDYTGFAFPAQSNAAIDAWFATGFLSEMMSNVITGKMTAAQAVEDATAKGKVIFEEKGLPQ
jgi:multiple sugar transport system substrate-binding protein